MTEQNLEQQIADKENELIQNNLCLDSIELARIDLRKKIALLSNDTKDLDIGIIKAKQVIRANKVELDVLKRTYWRKE